MKIADASPDRLVLTDRPWFLAGTVWVMGAVALGAGLFASDIDSLGERLLVAALGLAGLWVAWRFFPFVTVVLDRSEGTATHAERRLGGTTRREMPLDRIERVATQRLWGETGPMERVALVTPDAWIPLETVFSGSPRRPLVNRINAWLAGGDTGERP